MYSVALCIEIPTTVDSVLDASVRVPAQYVCIVSSERKFFHKCSIAD